MAIGIAFLSVFKFLPFTHELDKVNNLTWILVILMIIKLKSRIISYDVSYEVFMMVVFWNK